MRGENQVKDEDVPWLPVEVGNRRGTYRVIAVKLTVRFAGQIKTVDASSRAVPASLAADADKSLATLVLGEF